MGNRIAIVYYSWSGNTDRIAGLISNKTGGRLFRIEPEKAYPGKYGPCTDQAKKEINEGFMPELKTFPGSLDDYDTVFIGSPVWWYTMAPPVRTFLSRSNLSGKKIVSFCTYGGGKGHFAEDIEQCCPGSEVLAGLALHGSGRTGDADGEVAAWLGRIGII